MPMVGEKFNDRRPLPERRDLSRELTALLVSGPAGAMDPVLWTLLLSGRSRAAAQQQRRQPRRLPGLAALRGFWAVAVRFAFARGP